MAERTYLAVDLKSFYASVECVERGLDPLTTNLVVADLSRTEKTICLAVTPSLKAWGISGRARLFEVVQRVKEVNAERARKAPGWKLAGSSSNDPELKADPSLAVDYIVAPPQMAHYMEWSTKVYSVYLKYIAPEDIINYSIDEVFMDVTNYLGTYGLSARDLAMKIILDVLETTGITATAGIGPNLYLCKIAMDIWAKRIPADKNGVRIAQLTEKSYRRNLWTHRPLTDFWRVGKGYAKKLEAEGLYTMGDIARCSIGKPTDYYNEELLYKMFGVNAELLIDHAWGWEPCTIADIKAYKVLFGGSISSAVTSDTVVMALPQRRPVMRPVPGDELRPIFGHVSGEDSPVELRQELVSFPKPLRFQRRSLFDQGHILPRGPGHLPDAVKDQLFSGDLFREVSKISAVVDPAQRTPVMLHVNISGFVAMHGESLAPELDAEFFQVFGACFWGGFHFFSLFSCKIVLAPFLPGSHGLLGI